jgi:hypothetical protein
MEQSLQEAIKTYYIIKEKYDRALNNKKKAILKDTELSVKEKRIKFKKINMKCIKCKKLGGTIFTRKDETLKAICGSTEPCGLNVEINKGKWENIRILDELLSENMNNLKENIIKTKLNFLFGYVDKDSSLTKFEELRHNLGIQSESQLRLQKKMMSVFDDKIKLDRIKEAEIKLLNEIGEIKKIGIEYKKSNEHSLITTMVEKYLSIIVPLVTQINDLKYVDLRVSFDDGDNEYTLISNPYTIEQTEEEIKGDKVKGVISFIK